MNALMLGLWCAAAAGAPPAPPLPQEPVAIAVMMFSVLDAALASVVTPRVAMLKPQRRAPDAGSAHRRSWQPAAHRRLGACERRSA